MSSGGAPLPVLLGKYLCLRHVVHPQFASHGVRSQQMLQSLCGCADVWSSSTARTIATRMQVRVPQHIAKMSVAVYTTLALVVLSASFVVVPVKELRTGSLHVQVRARLASSLLHLRAVLLHAYSHCIVRHACLYPHSQSTATGERYATCRSSRG